MDFIIIFSTHQKWFIAYFRLHVHAHVQISSWRINIKKLHAHFGRCVWHRHTNGRRIFSRKCILVNEVVIVHHHIHFDLKFVWIIREIGANYKSQCKIHFFFSLILAVVTEILTNPFEIKLLNIHASTATAIEIDASARTAALRLGLRCT